MKTRNPINRNDLQIKKTDKVLEVGGGHNPHERSNLIVDKYVDSNYHRSGDIKYGAHQDFMQADGENLPFKDKAFDYVICSHVLEHVENPEAFLKEQFRVAKRGYIEVPSLMGEYLVPKASHRWLILEIEGKIVMVEKERVGFKTSHDFGDFFLDYMPKQSIGYKVVQRTHGDIMTVRYEWNDEIEFVVNPTDEKYLKYFRNAWTSEIYADLFPQRGLFSELWNATLAFGDIIGSVFKSRIIKNFA